ncbi:MAG: hypothetical protein IPF57_15195 [Gammaproteobacteria bacterium]|jgi:porin|nr:hypothetical protein [Gammaproteobacteria bacterium]MBK8991872.1 hypothetical protein [Gammaproteobacteria bacterium]MBK9468796.1 hypothetical protein [Gammaproteobacteria bacterium]MBP6481876.1 hypothetical protein [Pseudomonadales bacterium]MBP7909861.1 hypothetical protein [Pseudomonadales bacterium]
MAQKGVTLDLDLYWMPQTILSGGKDEASASWGNAIAALKVDTGKAGLWPGGFFKVQTVTSFGNNLISDTGAIVPTNVLHGDYTTDFLNTALIGPMTLDLMPLSAYGVGADLRD